jgi:hypothetical protein
MSGGKRAVFAEAVVTDGSGRLVAKASSTFLVRTRTSGRDEASGEGSIQVAFQAGMRQGAITGSMLL